MFISHDLRAVYCFYCRANYVVVATVLLYNFHNMTVTSLFYHFFKLHVDILHGLENISIFNIWKLWLVRCDVIFGETSVILPKISESFWSKGIPLWWFPAPTLKLNNSKTAWPISAMYISFSSILNALSYEINMFSHCSSPLMSGYASYHGKKFPKYWPIFATSQTGIYNGGFQTFSCFYSFRIQPMWPNFV